MTITKETAIVGSIMVAAIGFYAGRITAEPPTPKNYSECMLEEAKTAKDANVMSAVHYACLQIFGR